jgi:hypothetical protein
LRNYDLQRAESIEHRVFSISLCAMPFALCVF